MPKFDANAPVTAENLRKAGGKQVVPEILHGERFRWEAVDHTGVEVMSGGLVTITEPGKGVEIANYINGLGSAKTIGDVRSLCLMLLGIDIAEAANGD